ncbi:MAG: VanZ family protein [Betaproteobacteria bacterium]|jgi:VanZ family protein|nr:VanZ family protein [Betaproteobacteria bacterium]NBY17685.1 VanZ family protein [Betaproteobacteria bacterium]
MNLGHPSSKMRLAAALGLALLLGNLWYHGQQSYAVNLIRPPIDKLVHVVLFASIGTLLWIAAGARRLLIVLGIAVLLGMLDELIQWFSPGRSAEWLDLLADAIGACLGVLLCSQIARRCAPPIGLTPAINTHSDPAPSGAPFPTKSADPD